MARTPRVKETLHGMKTGGGGWLVAVGIVLGGMFGWWIGGKEQVVPEQEQAAIEGDMLRPLEPAPNLPALSSPALNSPALNSKASNSVELALPQMDSTVVAPAGEWTSDSDLRGALPSDEPQSETAGELSAILSPKQPAETSQGWARFAAEAPENPAGKPLIAIIIDDVGANIRQADLAVNMQAPMTIAILPYADRARELARAARNNGHELLVHLPMEPENGSDPGPNALLSGLSEVEFGNRLDWNLSRFEGYVGINNHMGSLLTQDRAAMEVVLAEVGRRGLIFLDSRTIALTVAAQLGREMGVATLERDIFIDNVIAPAEIKRQLERVEEIARRNGVAVAIGHPHAATLASLNEWIDGIEQRGFQLAPLSAVLQAGQPPRSASLAPPGG